ncbi:unnamed protein product [Bursaphelenchus xylophilus]|uniref:(pine wood nematode) hypothetical protein n=1 Tax=Bursaphelenchus xylophilus TaxID=6326 RepID=A0A7I8X0N3_BURXY|nr:unnamed protein product [Bursaphelenchus xylophilus]CAG9129743.1 unnamed protein product [Bursaphelenchus xylophilus]
MNEIFLVLAVLSTVITAQVRPKQWVAVTGKVNCNGVPAKGVKVKIYDVDDWTLDDKVAEVVTGEDGVFHLKGYTYEITTMDPKLNIYHNCNALTPICYIKFNVLLPKSIVNREGEPTQEYDAGTFSLDNTFPGQGTDCLNK